MNKKLVKTLGLGASLIGAVAVLVSDWANEQEMKHEIKERVNEELDKRFQEMESPE